MHEHHRIEEEAYFPWLEERLGAGSMSSNVDGHHAFEAPFKTFEELVASIRDKKAPFVPDAFRAVVYGFMPPLMDHLRAEVETIRVDKVKHIPEVDVWKVEADTEKMIKEHTDLTTHVQTCVMNGDGKYGLW